MTIDTRLSPGSVRLRAPSDTESEGCALSIRLLVLSLAVSPAAFAAHPLQTEDTGTQGAGNVEIENGLARARQDGTQLTTFQPQVSVGLATALDAIVQPSLVRWRAPGQCASGWGDTNLDAKWRFWGRDPWSLALRAGLQAPTSQHGLGVPRGQWGEHAVLVATWDAAPPPCTPISASRTRRPRRARARRPRACRPR